MQKDFCNGCKYNFATESMFMQHRTGAFSTGKAKQLVGVSPRRCLTVEEMQKKGWELRTLDVSVRIEGIGTKQSMQTWVLPGQLEAREAKVERMKKQRAALLSE